MQCSKRRSQWVLNVGQLRERGSLHTGRRVERRSLERPVRLVQGGNLVGQEAQQHVDERHIRAEVGIIPRTAPSSKENRDQQLGMCKRIPDEEAPLSALAGNSRNDTVCAPVDVPDALHRIQRKRAQIGGQSFHWRQTTHSWTQGIDVSTQQRCVRDTATSAKERACCDVAVMLREQQVGGQACAEEASVLEQVSFQLLVLL